MPKKKSDERMMPKSHKHMTEAEHKKMMKGKMPKKH